MDMVSLETTLGEYTRAVKISVVGSRSINEQDLRRNLKFFLVTETSIKSIGSKLVTRIFDEYVNNLKYMYSIRINGDSVRVGTTLSQPTPNVSTPPSVVP